MAESMSTDCETVVKGSFASPTNYSENSSVSYNSPLSESQTPPSSYDVKASPSFMEVGKNNGNLTENEFPNNNLFENSPQCDIEGNVCQSEGKIKIKTPESINSMTESSSTSSNDVNLETKPSINDNIVDSDEKIFCKPDISPKSEKSPRELRSPRSDRSGKSPKYSPRSEASPRPERSPKPERRSERKLNTPDITETAAVVVNDTKTKIKNSKVVNSAEEFPKNGAVNKKSRSRSKEENTSSKSRKRMNNNSSGRGRPPKQKDSVMTTTYHSQISGDKNAIKICIKKAKLIPQQQAPTNKKSKKRRRQRVSDSENSDFETYTTTKRRSSKKSSDKIADKDVSVEVAEPEEQTVWGSDVPVPILFRIFQEVCNDVGCLPTLVRLSKVCKLWNSVAVDPKLWVNIDLFTWHKERQKTDFKLHWLIDNRLSHCQDLNLSNWKANNISFIFDILTEKCLDLQGLNLSGWNGLTSDHLKHISTRCEKLQRLDLSSINSETTITKCAIGSQPLMQLADDMGERLTHLLLANNKLAGFPQIISAIATHCPNLQLLDLSNIRTVSHTTAPLHIEKLQQGCEKLRVLRITNSQIVLASASLKEQVESPGFPNLEELSVATGTSDVTLIDDNAIERILKNSHKLRLLDVRGCTRISDSSLVRVPAWDLEHLFLSGCYVTRFVGSGLELIVQKWSHSLLELDLGWSTATEPLDAAVFALAEKEDESRLRILNLCGSSVSLDPVKAVLKKCRHLNSINLSSCRALPRGIKRLYEGTEVAELLASLEEKPKPKKVPTPEPTPEPSPPPPVIEPLEDHEQLSNDLVSSLVPDIKDSLLPIIEPSTDLLPAFDDRMDAVSIEDSIDDLHSILENN